MANQIELEQSDHLRTPKNKEHYNPIRNPRDVVEYPVKVKPSRGVVGPPLEIKWTT